MSLQISRFSERSSRILRLGTRDVASRQACRKSPKSLRACDCPSETLGQFSSLFRNAFCITNGWPYRLFWRFHIQSRFRCRRIRQWPAMLHLQRIFSDKKIWLALECLNVLSMHERLSSILQIFVNPVNADVSGMGSLLRFIESANTLAKGSQA